MADEVEKLDFIEEKELRSGHLLSLVLGDHDKAQVGHRHRLVIRYWHH